MKSMVVERGWCSWQPREVDCPGWGWASVPLCAGQEGHHWQAVIACLSAYSLLGTWTNNNLVSALTCRAYESVSEPGWGGRPCWGVLMALPREASINACDSWNRCAGGWAGYTKPFINSDILLCSGPFLPVLAWLYPAVSWSSFRFQPAWPLSCSLLHLLFRIQAL